MGNNSKSKITPYLYLVPCMLIFGVFLFYPFVKTIYLSLYKTNKMGQAKLYVGLDNYKELIQSASFINSLKVTLIFVLIVVVGGMLLGLIAAVLCNKAFPGIRVFSTSYALPMAIASSSAAMIFQIMLHPAVGIVNKLLGLDINWLNDPVYAKAVIIIGLVWRWTGYNMVFYLSAMQSIDYSIYEAARIDGANSYQQLMRITIPLLRPIILVTAIMSTNGTLQLFDESVNLTRGGPGNMTITMSHYIYNTMFTKNPNFGYAAAMSFVILVMVAVLAAIQMKVGDKR